MRHRESGRIVPRIDVDSGMPTAVRETGRRRIGNRCIHAGSTIGRPDRNGRGETAWRLTLHKRDSPVEADGWGATVVVEADCVVRVVGVPLGRLLWVVHLAGPPPRVRRPYGVRSRFRTDGRL
jgi:hypothetical protein